MNVYSNIGDWVGPQFRDALKDLHDDLAFQGVDSDSYPANLADYIERGGSDECAEAMGQAVNHYVAECPDAKIVVSGWR